MKLKYALSPNKLKTGNKNSYLAKVQSNGSVDLENIIDRICYPGSGITKAEATGVITELNKAIEESLEEGFTVNLPFVNIKPSIRGQFEGLDDYFQPNRHELRFTVSSGKSLKSLPKKVRLQKVSKSLRKPSIRQLIDKYTGEEVQQLKPLMVIEIRGNHFNFPKDDEEVGVYLESKQQQVKTQILHCENSSTILLVLPQELPAGEARLRIVVHYQNHTDTKSCYSQSYQIQSIAKEEV